MQFSCESCKAQLQIADEKVRGKRLLVRCKRCGAKIAISDPALARPKTGPVRVAPPPSRPPPAVPSAPAPKAAPAAAPERHDSDTESTRAMDSEVLEQALQASKAEESPAKRRAPAPEPARQPEPEPARQPEPEPALRELTLPEPALDDEGPVWFAMVHGKQSGPVTRAELAARVDEGAVGPRTYLWKEGMDAWQRATDIPELQHLFPGLPEAPAPQQPRAAPQPVPARPPAAPTRVREFIPDDFDPPASVPAVAPETPRIAKPPIETPVRGVEKQGNGADPLALERDRQEDVARELFTPESGALPKTAADLAGWASAELQKKSVPPGPRTRSRASFNFEGASPRRSGLPLVMAGVVALLAAVAAAVWYFAGSGAPPKAPEKQETQAQAPASPETSKPPAKAPESSASAPAPATGLSADQVKKKLDENKPALQGCIDEALRRDPNLHVGKIHIATRIAPSGTVTAARIDKPNVEQSPLGACLRKATQRISFPSFAGDAFEVDIPINVTAGD